VGRRATDPLFEEVEVSFERRRLELVPIWSSSAKTARAAVIAAHDVVVEE
jgi:hypothetical protein